MHARRPGDGRHVDGWKKGFAGDRDFAWSLAPAPELTPIQRRILGVLVEKAITTPDAYPLTSNATITACNQKSNREPVSNYEAHEVDEALIDLKPMGLVFQVFSATGRTERWKHNLREAWNLEKPALSVLAELFLRGPQTEGDLRARASRMTPMATLEDLRAILQGLADGDSRNGSRPRARKRGVIWGHLCLTPREKESLEHFSDDEEEESGEVASPRSTGSSSAIKELIERIEQLEARVGSAGNEDPLTISARATADQTLNVLQKSRTQLNLARSFSSTKAAIPDRHLVLPKSLAIIAWSARRVGRLVTKTKCLAAGLAFRWASNHVFDTRLITLRSIAMRTVPIPN